MDAYICRFIYLFIYLHPQTADAASTSISIFISVYLSVYLSIPPSIHPVVDLSSHPSKYTPIYSLYSKLSSISPNFTLSVPFPVPSFCRNFPLSSPSLFPNFSMKIMVILSCRSGLSCFRWSYSRPFSHLWWFFLWFFKEETWIALMFLKLLLPILEKYFLN